MIVTVDELLVTYGFFESDKKARGAMKRGVVYIEGLRVANPTALLVLVHPVVLRCDGRECVIDPNDKLLRPGLTEVVDV